MPAPVMSDPPDRRQAWSTYWASGVLHSCVSSYEGNYAGRVGAFWRARFEALAPGARALDLGTGNGALPLLLDRVLQGREGARVEVDAVDFANVSPPWHDAVSHPNIRFHGGVSMEALPFLDASFDLVASQFGIEYARWPKALEEAMRVRAPGGVGAFVVHHAGSVLARVARSEAGNCDLLLAPAGLLASALEVLPWLTRARAGSLSARGSAEADVAREHYNRALVDVAGVIEGSPVPDLLLETRAAVHSIIASCSLANQQEQLELLQELAVSLAAGRLRARELVTHALDEPGIAAMVEVLKRFAPGAEATYEAMHEAQGVVAWQVLVLPRR